MLQRWQAGANIGEAGVVEVANNDALAFGLAINDLAPRVDQHTIAVRFASVFVLAALRHCQYIALVLNGAGAQQHFQCARPVVSVKAAGMMCKSQAPKARYSSGKRRS